MPPIPLLSRDAAVAVALAAASGAAVRAQPVRPGPFARGEVTFAMHAAIVGAFTGSAALDGVMRPVHPTGAVVTRPGGTDVQATFALDRRDYVLRPPVRALVLRVAPDVVVTARLSFSSGPGP